MDPNRPDIAQRASEQALNHDPVETVTGDDGKPFSMERTDNVTLSEEEAYYGPELESSYGDEVPRLSDLRIRMFFSRTTELDERTKQILAHYTNDTKPAVLTEADEQELARRLGAIWAGHRDRETHEASSAATDAKSNHGSEVDETYTTRESSKNPLGTGIEGDHQPQSASLFSLAPLVPPSRSPPLFSDPRSDVFEQAINEILEDHDFKKILDQPFDPTDYEDQFEDYFEPWYSNEPEPALPTDTNGFIDSWIETQTLDESTDEGDGCTAETVLNPYVTNSFSNRDIEVFDMGPWAEQPRIVRRDTEGTADVEEEGGPHTIWKPDLDNRSAHEWAYNDNASRPSSYAASVASIFSVTSLASSASDMSKGSGYSAVQIATATKVLLSIFYDDEALLSLYKSAVENLNIGPERLQRNLRRLFRIYAGLLESEATERLEYLASRLVLLKSASLAQSIVDKMHVRVGAQSHRSDRNEESSDEEDENCTDSRPVNEEAFEDLVRFREFLVGSEAFKTFRDRLEAFIVPKLTQQTNTEFKSDEDTSNAKILEPNMRKEVKEQKALTWQRWRHDAKKSTDGLFYGTSAKTTASSVFHLMADAIMLATDGLLIAAGQLEPPLRPNMVRLRWQCVRTSVLTTAFAFSVSSSTNNPAGLWRIPSQRRFRAPRRRYQRAHEPYATYLWCQSACIAS
jgi:hypothetical protein